MDLKEFGKKAVTGVLIASAVLSSSLGNVQAYVSDSVTNTVEYNHVQDFSHFISTFDGNTNLSTKTNRINMKKYLNNRFNSNVTSQGSFTLSSRSMTVQELGTSLAKKFLKEELLNTASEKGKSGVLHNAVIMLVANYHYNYAKSVKTSADLKDESKAYLYAFQIIENYAKKHDIKQLKKKVLYNDKEFSSYDTLFQYNVIKKYADKGILKTPYMYGNVGLNEFNYGGNGSAAPGYDNTSGKTNTSNTDVNINDGRNSGSTTVDNSSTINLEQRAIERAKTWISSHQGQYTTLKELATAAASQYGASSLETKKIVLLVSSGDVSYTYKKVVAPAPDPVVQDPVVDNSSNNGGYVESDNNEKYDNIYGNETTQEDIKEGENQIYWGGIKNNVDKAKERGMSLEQTINMGKSRAGWGDKTISDVTYYWNTGNTR